MAWTEHEQVVRLSVAARTHAPAVPFTPDAVWAYLDTHIVHWRTVRDAEACREGPWPSPVYVTAVQYLDAFQSVRTALFGGPYE